jgi:hypothetical protein
VLWLGSTHSIWLLHLLLSPTEPRSQVSDPGYIFPEGFEALAMGDLQCSSRGIRPLSRLVNTLCLGASTN